jgi:HAD superfamily hydrolase (TIGR01456 family)
MASPETSPVSQRLSTIEDYLLAGCMKRLAMTKPRRTLEVTSPKRPKNRNRTIAFAFDVDGVCVRGKEPIPGAREALRMLQDAKVPFIFLTNGGGLTEKAHVANLSTRLNMSLDEKQFVQSHSPFHDLVPLYKDKTILCLGGHGDQIRDLAQEYGFQNVITSSDLMAEWEHIHPFPEMTKEHHSSYGVRSGILHETEIAAILVWSSPRDWCLDLQVVTDLLLSSGGLFGKKSALVGDMTLPNNGYLQDGQPKLYFCNPDFEWATQHMHPRFAQGAFREALLGVWAYATKNEAALEYTIMGKPSQTTYVYGEKVLQSYNDFIHNDSEVCPAIDTVYMIGDNPESDIRGAMNFKSQFGAQWKSILVETGVYVPGTVPSERPNHIATDIMEAVKWALHEKGYAVNENQERIVVGDVKDNKEVPQVSTFTLHLDGSSRSNTRRV